MDLIGNIHLIENRLNERKSGQGKRRPEKGHARPEDERPAQGGEHHADLENDYHVGRIVDTTA